MKSKNLSFLNIFVGNLFIDLMIRLVNQLSVRLNKHYFQNHTMVVILEDLEYHNIKLQTKRFYLPIHYVPIHYIKCRMNVNDCYKVSLLLFRRTHT